METIAQIALDVERLNCSVLKSCCSLWAAETNAYYLSQIPPSEQFKDLGM